MAVALQPPEGENMTDNPIPTELLDEWQALSDKATPGPWEADIDDPGTPHEMCTGKFYCGTDDDNNWTTWCTYDDSAQGLDNYRFTAAARTAVPALIAEVRRLRS